LLEIFFGLQEKYEGGEFITMFFFVGTIVCFGYLLEINFVNKGVEAYGLIQTKPKRKRKPRAKAEGKPVSKAKNFVSSFKTITL